LETRRLRLLLQAYLRGLLKTTYENGYSSVIREEFILAAIEAEEQAAQLKNTADLEATITPHLNNQKAIQEALKRVQMKYAAASHLKMLNRTEFEYAMGKEREATKEQKQFAEVAGKIYSIMDKQGMLEPK
jgi:acyl-CoA hydrolase